MILYTLHPHSMIQLLEPRIVALRPLSEPKWFDLAMRGSLGRICAG